MLIAHSLKTIHEKNKDPTTILLINSAQLSFYYDCLVFLGWMEVTHCHYYI